MTRLLAALFRSGLALCGVSALGAFGCEQRKSEPLGVPSASEPSPNASVLPAPLAAGPTKQGARDAGHPSPDPSSDAAAPEPPRALREDDVLGAESELRPAPG